MDGPSAAAMVATIAGKLRGMSAADTARAARRARVPMGSGGTGGEGGRDACGVRGGMLVVDV